MEILISVIAIIVSTVALVRTREFNSKLLLLEEENAKLSKLQRKILEREEEKRFLCHVSAYWYKGENNSDRVAINNDGAVPAVDISFEFKPPEGKTSPGMNKVMEETFPIETLRPEEDRYFLIAKSMSTGSVWPAIISWKNESGDLFEENIVLGVK